MAPLSDAEILLGLAVAAEALTGFVFAEVIRLNFMTKWLTEKPQYTAAWMLGALTLVCNAGNLLLGIAGGTPIQVPTADMSLLPAVLLYPALCLGIWIVYLLGRSRSLWSGGPRGRG